MTNYIEEHLADGGVRVTAADRHYLNPDTGLWHRSVTGICGVYPAPRLLAWAVNSFLTYEEHQRYLTDKGDDGTATHDILEHLDRISYAQEYSKIWHYLVAARNFFRMFKPVIKRREFIIYGLVEAEEPSGDIRYGGTVDLDLMIDKGALDSYLANRRIKVPKFSGEMVPAILDYKTSNNIWRKMYLQVSAYQKATSEDLSGHETLILQLGTAHKLGFWLNRGEPGKDFEVFKHLAHIHKDCYPEDDPRSWLVEGELVFGEEQP